MKPSFSATLERLFLALAMLFVASWPGSVTRAWVVERVAPPVPDAIRERDGAIDVRVSTPDGAPIGGARVRALAVLDDRAHLAAEGVTDAAGALRLTGLPRAAHWVLADAPGRARGATMVATGGGSTSDAAIALEPEHVLDVAVVDEGGRAVAGAELEITGRDPLPIGARTGEDGRARVGRLTQGPFVLTARAPGWDEATQRGVLEGATARVVLRKLAAVKVRVTFGGEGVAGARVEIAGASLWPARAARTDASGSVRIASLAKGSYALRATEGERVSPTELDVALDAGDERELELKLEPGAMIPVRVVEGDDASAEEAPAKGAGIAGARVTLVEGGLSSFPLQGVADRAGHVRLGPIVRGAASVSARADGFVARGGLPVPEPLGAPVIVRLPRAGTVTGRVLDARGFPIDGATVVLVGTDFQGGPIDDDPRRTRFRDAHFAANLAGPRPLIPAGELGVMPGKVPPIPRAEGALAALTAATAPDGAPLGPPEEPWVTRADGTFRARPATPGRVRALVRHPEFVEALGDAFTLTAGGEAHVEVVMHRGGALEGRVVDGAGHPVDGARVTVSAMRGALERSVRAAPDGTFAFAALPDAVAVLVSLDTDAPGAIRARLSLTIPEGGKREVTIALPAPRPPLAVRVVDDRGYPASAVQLSASSLDPGAPLRTTTYSDGRGEANIDGGATLPLRIEAHAPGFAPLATTVEPGARAPVLLTLARAESATGEVRGARGDRLRHAEVTLYTELGARHARTAEDGTFTVRDLSPGPARIRVRAAGYATLERAVPIPAAGGRHPAVLPPLALEPEATVAGTVVDERGEPVQGARVARDTVPTYLAAGATPRGLAVTDAHGRFRIAELEEGAATFEALAPDRGVGRVDGVRLVAGRVTEGVRITLRRTANGAPSPESAAAGGVAVTLAVDTEDQVLLASVAEGSAAERAGLMPSDTVLAIDGARVRSIAEARAKLSGPLALDVLLTIERRDRRLVLRVPREPVRR